MEHSTIHLVPAGLALDQILFLLLPLPLILVANWHDRPAGQQEAGAPGRVTAAVGSTIWVLLLLVALVVVSYAVLSLVTAAASPERGTAGGPGFLVYGLVLMASGAASAALVAEPVRRAIARVVPIDPRSAVHATALVLSVSLVGSQIANQLAVDVLSQQASTGTALVPLDLVGQELPFLLAALLGVGMFIRRTPARALDRLGLVRPTIWQLILALGAAGVFYAFGNGVDALAQLITPGTAQKVAAANERLFGQLGNPVGIATIALAAGICEETLFRGAMQPRLGLVWTAIVFTAIHTQYGLSLDAAAVFVLALGLGALRWLTNTTTSMVCHVVYNTLVGVSVGGVLLGPALTLEAGLLLASLAAFLTGRVGNLRTAP